MKAVDVHRSINFLRSQLRGDRKGYDFSTVLFPLVFLGLLAAFIGDHQRFTVFLFIPVIVVLCTWRILLPLICRKYRMNFLLLFGCCSIALSVIMLYLLQLFLFSFVSPVLGICSMVVFVAAVIWYYIYKISRREFLPSQRYHMSLSPIIGGLLLANIAMLFPGKIERFSALIVGIAVIGYLLITYLITGIGLSLLTAFAIAVRVSKLRQMRSSNDLGKFTH